MSNHTLLKYALSAVLLAALAPAKAQVYNGGSLYQAAGGVMYIASGLTNDGTLGNAAGATILVKSSLINNASGTINNSGDLRVAASTINNGSVSSAGNSNLVLESPTPQTLSGSVPISAKNVTINAPLGVRLNTPMQVDGTMTFTSGIILASSASAPVIFTANSSLANTPTDASHVNGYVQKQGMGAFVFPVGDAARYQPVAVNLSANTAGLTVRYTAGDAGSAPFGTSGASSSPLLYYNAREYWNMTPAGTASGTVTIYYDDYNNPGIGNPSDLRVAHRSGGEWQNEGANGLSGNLLAGSLTSGNITTWSPFTLGSISVATPLPVRLEYFQVQPDDHCRILLSWKTADEKSGDKVSIEQSADGRTFARVAPAQLRNDGAAYEAAVPAPGQGRWYYRLSFTAANGGRTFSETAGVQSRCGAGDIHVYPNPVRALLTVSGTTGGGTAQLYDRLGRIAQRAATEEGSTTMDLRRLPAGVYHLVIRQANGQASRTISITKPE